MLCYLRYLRANKHCFTITCALLYNIAHTRVCRCTVNSSQHSSLPETVRNSFDAHSVVRNTAISDLITIRTAAHVVQIGDSSLTNMRDLDNLFRKPVSNVCNVVEL